ncbi:MAG: MFS transporter [archaeon]
MTQSYESNIWKYYLFRFVSALELTISIFVLFLLANDLSMVQIMLLESIFMITILLLEVPSGVFADIFGRKKALVLSLLSASVGFIVFGIGNTFWVFLIAQLLVALGWSLESGADSALVYDSLKEINKEKDYAKVFGRSTFIAHFTWAGSALLSGFLAIYLGYKNLFFMTAFLFFLGSLMALWFKEPPIHKKVAGKNYLAHLIDAVKFTYNHKIVRNLIIFYGMFAAITHLAWFVIQPFYDSSALPKYFVGIAVSIYCLFAGMGSLIGYYFMAKIKVEKLPFLLLLIASISFIGLFFIGPLYGLILIAIMSLASGVRDIYVSKGVQENTDSHHRATVGSIQSFSKSIMYAIFAPILGYLVDVFTPGAAFLLMGIGLLLFCIYYLIMVKLSRNKAVL